MLDIGTGSGVLAMAAAFGGASDVLGLDVDQDAIDAARASAALNHAAAGRPFRDRRLRADPLPPADLVVANLTGGMLRMTAATLVEL